MAGFGIRRLWIGYLILSGTLAVVRALNPETSTVAILISAGYPLLTMAAIATGIRLNRPARKLPWRLLIAMMIMQSIGTAILGKELAEGGYTFPSPADIFWLSCYPIELAALLLLVNGLRWRQDRAGVLDTLMVTGGLGLGVWLLFLRDLFGPAMPLNVRLASMAYPLATLLLLACMLRMCISAVRRSPAYLLLVAALGLQGLTQGGLVWLTSHGMSSNAVAPTFVLSTLLLGAAALHPSMAAMGGKSIAPAAEVTRGRVVLIGSACLLSPVLLIVNGVVGGGRVDWLAASICCIVVFLLVIARMVGLIRIVQDQADRLESIAYQDALTGIPNRRAWDAELERRIAVARRTGGAMVVGLIDLDHFKNFNDLFGHPAGDALLRDASAAWQDQLRAEDLIARYGGEEFGVILHGRLRDAATVMERLREVTPEGQTFSAGLALWSGDESIEQLMARVDAALYTAKREGRDQYSVTGNPSRTDLQSDFLAGAAGAAH